MRRLAVLAVLLGLVWLQPSPARAGGPRFLVVGDSTLLAVDRMVVPDGFFGAYDVDFQVRNCRKTLTEGCREQKVSGMDTLLEYRNAVDVIWFQVGYNDNPGYDRWSEIIDTVMTEVGTWEPAPYILWPTMRSAKNSYTDENRALLDARARWPRLLVPNWWAYAQPHEEWFVDSIHTNGAGAKRLAQFMQSWFDGVGFSLDAAASTPLTKPRPGSYCLGRICVS